MYNATVIETLACMVSQDGHPTWPVWFGKWFVIFWHGLTENSHACEMLHTMISVNRDYSCYMMLGRPTSTSVILALEHFMYIWKPIGGWCLLHGLLHSRCGSILRYIAGQASWTTWIIINQQIPGNVVNCWKTWGFPGISQLQLSNNL